jgi:hypothetical protein
VARIGELHIGNDEELREQLARAVEEREVLLVLPHRQDQAFLRHGEERRVEAADVDAGVLDQRGHFVEEIAILAERAFLLARRSLQGCLDFPLAPVKVRDHILIKQGLLVLAGGGECDFSFAHKAMPARAVA